MRGPIDPRRIELIDPAVVAVLRKMWPYERIALAADAFETARQLLQAQVMRTHPDWPEEQVRREVARRIAGDPDGPPPTTSGVLPRCRGGDGCCYYPTARATPLARKT